MNVVYFCFHTFSFYFHYQYKLFPIKKKLHHLFIKLKGLSKYEVHIKTDNLYKHIIINLSISSVLKKAQSEMN